LQRSGRHALSVAPTIIGATAGQTTLSETPDQSVQGATIGDTIEARYRPPIIRTILQA
jgi:hypothetical protein